MILTIIRDSSLESEQVIYNSIFFLQHRKLYHNHLQEYDYKHKMCNI